MTELYDRIGRAASGQIRPYHDRFTKIDVAESVLPVREPGRAEVQAMESRLMSLNNEFGGFVAQASGAAAFKQLMPLLFRNPLPFKNDAETGNIPGLVLRFSTQTRDEHGEMQKERFLILNGGEAEPNIYTIKRQTPVHGEGWRTIGIFVGNKEEVLDLLKDAFAQTHEQHRKAMPMFWRKLGAIGSAFTLATVGAAALVRSNAEEPTALPLPSVSVQTEAEPK